MSDQKASTPSEQPEATNTQENDTIVQKNDLAVGILQLLRPAVDEVDNRVLDIRRSQVDLREQIDQLSLDLQKLASQQQPPVDLEVYVKKLLNCRRRVVLVNSVLNNAHERLNKLQQNIIKETNKRRASLAAPLQ